MASGVAATPGLVDPAGPGGATCQQLAAEADVAVSALQRLSDHLVTVDVFVLDPSSGRYRATDLGAQMRRSAPDGGVLPPRDIARARPVEPNSRSPSCSTRSIPTGRAAPVTSDATSGPISTPTLGFADRSTSRVRGDLLVPLPTGIRRLPTTAVDLFMPMCFGGGDRSLDELGALATASGLRVLSHRRVSGGRVALELATG